MKALIFFHFLTFIAFPKLEVLGKQYDAADIL
jgi:hypothetical protein